MTDWLNKYKNILKTPSIGTDKADTGHEMQTNVSNVSSLPRYSEKNNLVLALHQLEKHGLIKIRSSALNGEIVYFAKDQAKAANAPRGAVVYTLDELKQLVTGPPDTESLRQVHEAKRLFGGRVVANNGNEVEIRKFEVV